MSDKKNNIYKILIIATILVGLIVRILFINSTSVIECQFDAGVGELKTAEDYENVMADSTVDGFIGRHLDYILQVYKTGKIPDKIIGQYYHPPLGHAIFAGWLKIMDIFTDSAMIKIESMQYISVLYSMLIIFSFIKILNEFDISLRNKLLAIMIVTFIPIGIYMSGTINNDQLVTLFSLLSLLYLIRWKKDQSYKNTILLSLCIGLGLLTKSSIVVMILPCIIVYFITLHKSVYEEDNSWKKLVVEAVILMVIVCALGLPYHIYSLSIGKNTVGISQPPEDRSVAMYSLFDRFGPSNIFKLKEYNLFNSYINSQVGFGLVASRLISEKIMIILVFVLFIQSLYMMIIYYKDDIVLLTTFVSWWFGFIYLNLSMPYLSSANSRYMIVPILCGLLLIMSRLEKSESKIFNYEMIFTSSMLTICSIVYFMMCFVV